MSRKEWIDERIGKRLVLGFCGYEVLALEVERYLPAYADRLPTLSRLCGRYRSGWPGRVVIGGLWTWLAVHLFLE